MLNAGLQAFSAGQRFPSSGDWAGVPTSLARPAFASSSHRRRYGGARIAAIEQKTVRPRSSTSTWTEGLIDSQKAIVEFLNAIAAER